MAKYDSAIFRSQASLTVHDKSSLFGNMVFARSPAPDATLTQWADQDRADSWPEDIVLRSDEARRIPSYVFVSEAGIKVSSELDISEVSGSTSDCGWLRLTSLRKFGTLSDFQAANTATSGVALKNSYVTITTREHAISYAAKVLSWAGFEWDEDTMDIVFAPANEGEFTDALMPNPYQTTEAQFTPCTLR